MAQDQLNKKIISLSFVAAAIIAAYLTSVTLEILAGFFVSFVKIYDKDSIRRGLPVLVGIITLVVLAASPKIRSWTDSVVSEVRKVVWPTRNELSAMTVACLIMLIVAGFFLGGVDFVASRVIQALLG